ncbi:hypothetical protein [Serratia fonticola]|uniref:hypothetical protein n=1 Tax=Serratia fonticola TaxID=47917 RepID=UPI0021770327|nr:hypothetical protein [Serratia fonticola]CAI1686858.1 Uncharacterised protein [Serratia fonticola]
MSKKLEELSQPIAYTDREELDSMKNDSYAALWFIPHGCGQDIALYSQEYVTALIQRAEAAEQRLQQPIGYFAYSDDIGYEEFDTAEQASMKALEEIDLYREDASDGWPEQVDRVCWGLTLQRASGFDHQDIKPDERGHTYQTCNYRLEPLLEQTTKAEGE